MANALYPTFLTFAWAPVSTGDVKVLLGDAADYTYNAAHDFLDDVAAGAIVSTSGNLASKTFGTVAAGVFDAASPTLTAVTGDVCEFIIVYIDTGVASTSRLICYLELTGPVTPNGGNIVVDFSGSGIAGI